MPFPNDTSRYDSIEIDGSLLVIRPVGALVWDTVTGGIYRSNDAAAIGYDAMVAQAVSGNVDIPVGSTLTFASTDVVITPDGTNVLVTSSTFGEMRFNDSVFVLRSLGDATKLAVFDLSAIPSGEFNVYNIPGTSGDLGATVKIAANTELLQGAVVLAGVETAFGGAKTLAANAIGPSTVFHIRATATQLDATGISAVTLRIRIGGVAGILLAETAAFAGVTNDVFVIDCYVTVRSSGAAGTITSTALTSADTPGAPTTMEVYVLPATASLNTTIAQSITCTAEFAANNSDLRLDQFIIEQI